MTKLWDIFHSNSYFAKLIWKEFWCGLNHSPELITWKITNNGNLWWQIKAFIKGDPYCMIWVSTQFFFWGGGYKLNIHTQNTPKNWAFGYEYWVDIQKSWIFWVCVLSIYPKNWVSSFFKKWVRMHAHGTKVIFC